MTTAQLTDASRTERDHQRELLQRGLQAVRRQVERQAEPVSQKQLEEVVAAQTQLPLTVIRLSIWRLLSSGVLRFTPEEGDIAST